MPIQCSKRLLQNFCKTVVTLKLSLIIQEYTLQLHACKTQSILIIIKSTNRVTNYYTTVHKRWELKFVRRLSPTVIGPLTN